MQEPITLDDIRVHVQYVEYRPISFDDESSSKESYIVLKLSITTSDPNKKYDHTSWSTRDSFVEDECVVIRDEHGNKYSNANMSYSSNKPKDYKMYFAVTSEKPGTDWLFIEKPAAGAKELRITLSSTEKSPKFRFLLPRSVWDKK